MPIDLSEINRNFHEAHEIKEIARKDNEHIPLYLKAADKFECAANGYSDLIESNGVLSDESIRLSKALMHYYLYEGFSCKYAFSYKNCDYSKAIEMAEKAKQNAMKALQYISMPFQEAQYEEKAKKNRNNFEYVNISLFHMEMEPLAKRHQDNGEFIEALDVYMRMRDLEENSIQYLTEKHIGQAYVRIAKGNLMGANINIAQMTCAHLLKTTSSQSNNWASQSQIFKNFITAFESAKQAASANPEWELYRSGQIVLENNIRIFLDKNREYWKNIYVEVGKTSKWIEVMMSEIDKNELRDIKQELDFVDNGAKKLYFYGGFWIVLLATITLNVKLFVDYKLAWYFYPMIFSAMAFLYSIVGAFILRSMSSVSEEGFLELMKMTFSFGLSSLFSKQKNNQSGS